MLLLSVDAILLLNRFTLLLRFKAQDEQMKKWNMNSMECMKRMRDFLALVLKTMVEYAQK